MYTYTALIDLYGRAKNYEAVEEVLAEMCEVGCDVSIVTFSLVMRWYREAKNLAGIRRVLEHMQREGCLPNEYIYTTFIDALDKDTCHEEALAVFKEMRDSNWEPNIFTYNVLIHSLATAGKLDGAREMFGRLPEPHHRPNFVTYTILVTAHVKAGELEKAVHFLKTMMEAGFMPSHGLRSILFTALMAKGRADEVAELTLMCTAMGLKIHHQKSETDGIYGRPPGSARIAGLLISLGPETVSALYNLKSRLPSQFLLNIFTRMSGHPEAVWRFYKWLRSQDAHVSSKYVFAEVLDILGKAGYVEMQLEAFADAEAAKVANGVMYNTLIHSYCTAKQTDASS